MSLMASMKNLYRDSREGELDLGQVALSLTVLGGAM